MNITRRVEWLKLIDEHGDDVKSVQTVMQRLTESLITAQEKILHDVVYNVLGRDYDHTDLANFSIRVEANTAGWAVFYKGIELGAIKSEIINDKFTVGFYPE